MITITLTRQTTVGHTCQVFILQARPFPKITNLRRNHGYVASRITRNINMTIVAYLGRGETFIALAGKIFPQHVQRSQFRQFTQYVEPTRAHAARLICTYTDTSWAAVLACYQVLLQQQRGAPYRLLPDARSARLVDSKPPLLCVCASFIWSFKTRNAKKNYVEALCWSAIILIGIYSTAVSSSIVVIAGTMLAVSCSSSPYLGSVALLPRRQLHSPKQGCILLLYVGYPCTYIHSRASQAEARRTKRNTGLLV